MIINQITTRIEASGPNKVLTALSRGLAEFGHDVRVISLQAEQDEPLEVAKLKNGGVSYTPLQRSDIFGQVRELRGLARSGEPAIWHTHCLRSLFLAVSAGLTNHVYTSHNIPDEQWPLHKGALIGTSVAIANNLLMYRANAVVTISPQMQEKLAALGIRSTLIRNPVILDEFTASRDSRSAGRMKFLVAGTLIRRKNVVMVLRALKGLPDALRDRFELLIAGAGEDEAMLKEMAADLPHVRFLGFVNDMPPVFAEVDVVMSASLSEGLPIALLEAMAAGRPLVLSDIPPHRSMAEGATGDFIRLFKVDDAALIDCLTNLISQPFRASAEEIRNWCARLYDHKAVAADYVSLYDALRGGRKQAAS